MAHDSASENVTSELRRGKQMSIVSLVNALVECAHSRRASDIHIDPTAESVRIRLRIDGVLQESFTFPKHIHQEIISRIKVISKLRTDEHHATQDGRFRYVFGTSSGKNSDVEKETCVDVRVSIIPTYHGENAVLRLLSDKAESFTLEMLGFSESDRRKIVTALSHPSGMILATGPTGSGKTTTLYTLIKMLNRPDVSIITIEDPIEYAVEDIEQIQVNPRTGLTFGSGLRSILRQDPNIIMVGEIRDEETARIAVNTALTGHLLLSTLHTCDAATTLPRLLDMGIEEYLVASTVSIAIGQRLVRRICEHCKKKIQLTGAMRESFANTVMLEMLRDVQTIFVGVGCDACGGSGYSGRMTINEVLVADDPIREAIVRKAGAQEIKKIAMRGGMTTILEDGARKVVAGLTTVEEVLRVIHE